jgi:endonuclease III
MEYIDSVTGHFQKVRTPVDEAFALLRGRATRRLEPTIGACERAMRAEREAVDSLLTTLQRRLRHLEEMDQIQRTTIDALEQRVGLYEAKGQTSGAMH